MNLSEGIEVGQIVSPEHILRSINALSGKSTNDIIIKGSLTSIGNFNNDGNVYITGSSLILGDQNILGSLILKNAIIERDGSVFCHKLSVNSLIDTLNLTISGSLKIKDISQDQSKNVFLSLDLLSGLVTYSTGSLTQKKAFSVDKFKFSSDLLEDQISFQGKIDIISISNTDIIENINIYSKIDVPSLDWNKHNNIESLQNWINSDISKDTLFWIKIIVTYKQYNNGRSESILKYYINE